MRAVAVATAVLSIVGLILWWEVSLWNECRAQNSFWYCFRVLGR